MSDRRADLSDRLIAALVALFPAEFRARFGDDMVDLFRDQRRAARRRSGRAGVLALWLRTIPRMLRAALVEHWERHRLPQTQAPSTTTGRSDGMLQTLTSDLRYAGRMLRQSPVFTIVAVVVISLGSGAVSTIFSAMNAGLLRPLPGATNPERLVAIERRTPGFGEGISASNAYYRTLRDRTRTLDGLAAWSKASLSIATAGEGTAVYANIVSGNYFAVLGVRPLLGRFFLPDEDQTPLTHPVLVVSEGFWRTHLGADSAVIGKPVTVNGHPFTIIGVAPTAFRGAFTPIVTEAWAPLMMQQWLRPGRDLDQQAWLWVFGRMKEGVTREAVGREMEALTAAYIAEGGERESWRKYTAIRTSGMNGLPADARRAMLSFAGLLLGAAVLVLVIASVNVASMLSARAIARQREMAVRAALGAGRLRLVRQVLTEILVLFALGGAGGLVIALQSTAALERLSIPADVTIVLELSPDYRVLVFAVALSLGTGILFGLAPAFQAARSDIATRLRASSAASGTRRHLFHNILIVGQLALSLVLLVTAGLFLRTLRAGNQVDPGFTLHGVITAQLNTESWGYDTTQGRAFFRELRERVRALPGVTGASYVTPLPLAFASSGARITVEGSARAAAGPDGSAKVSTASVDADFFSVLELPVVRGRAITEADDEHAPRVVVVNETLAREFWPDGSALGRTFRLQDAVVTIVGIARDAKYDHLNEDTPSFVYVPIAQAWQPARQLIVRGPADAGSFAVALREAMHAIDPALPRPTVLTMEQTSSIVLLPQRVASVVTAVLGGVGLLLATVGLYGVIAYSTNRRTREIGVRMALGARRVDVLRMVVREGMGLAGIGVVVGLVLAAGVTRLMSALLFGVSPLDGVTFVGMSVVFLGAAWLASYVPARRAAGASPMAALRTD